MASLPIPEPQYRAACLMNTVDIQGKRYQLATLTERLAAFILDALIFALFGLISVFVNDETPMVLRILSILIVGDIDPTPAVIEIMIMIYFLIIDGMPNGQSFGKRIIKIQVVTETTGMPCTVGNAILRRFPSYVLPFIDIALVFCKEKQRLGDKIAKTRVVKPFAMPILN